MLEALPAIYQAWTWQGSADPRALELQERALPVPSTGEVIVRNGAIGLNPVDWKVLDGSMGWTTGHVPGVDGAGIVVEVGPGLSSDWLGKSVAYHQDLSAHGSFAQYVPVSARALLQLPDGMDLPTAASVPCPALTAWMALAKLPARPGGRLLVSGAGGAVGNYLVQLGSEQGWHVTVLCHERHRERLRHLGAAHWIAGPLTGDQAIVNEIFDVVIDTIDSQHAQRLHATIGANGHLICIQGRVAEWPNPPFGRAISLHEVALGALHKHGSASDWAHLTSAGTRLLQRISAGSLMAEPLVTAPFECLGDHLEALRHRKFTGKPVITFS